MEQYRGAYPTRSVEQVRLIEGQAFSLGYVRTFLDPLPATESIDIALAFPSGMNPIMSISGLSSGNAIGYLYEGSVVSGGTSLPIVNRNRASTITSKGVAIVNPTITSLGTLVLQEILTGGVGKKGAGGEAGGDNLILKGLTTYLFRLTNADTQNNAHASEIILTWNE
jgi:hypothetical protein